MENDQVKVSVDQWGSAMKKYSSTWPHADLVDRPGTTTFWADSPFALWNGLLLNRKSPSESSLRASVEDAIKYMRQKRWPGLLYSCEEHTAREEQESFLQVSGSFPIFA